MPTPEHHDWVKQTLGVDPTTYGNDGAQLADPAQLQTGGGGGAGAALPKLKVVTPDMATACRGYLTRHHLAALLLPGTGGTDMSAYQPAIDGGASTIDKIAASLLPLTLQLPGAIDELHDLVQFQYSSMVSVAIVEAQARQKKQVQDGIPPFAGVDSPGLALPADMPKDKAQSAVQVGVAYAVHANVDGTKPDTPADYTLQLTFAKTFQHHAEGEDGGETQYLIQFGYNLTNGQPTVLGGVQEAWVMSLFHGLVQASVFVQALQGISLGGNAKGSFKFNPATQVQPGAGAQVQMQLGPVSVFVQPAVSVTTTQGSPSTYDGGVTLGVSF